MKKIYLAIVAATAIVQMMQADYINDSWGFRDFEANKIYKPTTLSVQAINQAIRDASENGGGRVIIPAGTLNANNPIIIKDNVKLQGTLINNKRATFINANYDIASGKRGLIISYHTTNTTIEDLNLDLKGHNLTAISYVEGNQHNFLISNNSIKNAGFPKYEVAQAKGILPRGYSPMDGISLHDWGEKEYSSNFTIKDNIIENYSEHGINLHYVRRFIIDNNRMKNGIMGVDISTGSREGEILNNDISDVVAGAKIIGNEGEYDQEIYFHNNYSHDNPRVTYHDDVSGGTYDDGGRGLERQFEGEGIHIYNNSLNGYNKDHDMLYFSGAEKYQDDLYGNNEVPNPIQEIQSNPNSKLENSDITFSMNGDFKRYIHFGFFIDSDNNPNTGYSRGKIKGADFLVQKNGLYKYPKGTKGWHWERINSDMTVTHTNNSMSSTIPSKILNPSDTINYNASISTAQWRRTKVLATKSISLKSSLNNIKENRTKAFIPKLDFTKSDVYGNGQVVYVSNPNEFQQTINSAKPNTTIILRDGDYQNTRISFPKAKHHITIKAQNRHGAVIYPRGRDGSSAIYLPHVSNENEMIHDINFIDLEVAGAGDGKEFLFTPGVQYGHHHIYFKNIKMHGLFMGLYSGLSSHDWTMDGCEFYNSSASYMWYMMGYHQAVINSVMYNNSYYSLSIRGCYPPAEKFDYYHHENNPRIGSRSGHFLASDDWTHLIANNTFGSNYNKNRLVDAHIGLYYNADEGARDSEDVYFPPKNVMIFNNVFVDSGNGNKKMLNLMANRGINKGRSDSVDGLIIKNNFTDKRTLIDSDTSISSVDLSTNHTSVSEDKFGFDDSNRDYHISYDSILKDAGTNNPATLPWDFENKKKKGRSVVGAYEVN